MKYTVTAIVTMVLAAEVCIALGCGVGFYGYPDGSVHECVIWTGDPGDDGEFEIVDEVFRNVTGGSAHYIVDDECCGAFPGDVLSFYVEGTSWDFAWNVTTTDPACGTCLRLSHGERDGVWQYTLSRFAWQIPEGTTPPETAFTWHVGTELTSWAHTTPGALTGWHEVYIINYLPNLSIYVDNQAIFNGIDAVLPSGWIYGFGSTASETGTPAFVYLDSDVVPVESSTWGLIKSLYRAE